MQTVGLTKLGYWLGSLAAAGWVGLLLVAAGPGSETMARIYPAVEPVLDVFNIDHEWGFFSPNPDTGTVVRYRVTAVDGSEHDFHLTEALERWDPMFSRYATLYIFVVENGGAYEASAVRYLCRRHTVLDPEAISMIAAEQTAVTPDEFLEGTGILDEVELTVRPPRRCPGGELAK